MPKKLTLVDKLQRKLDKELDSFKKELLKLPPEELLAHAVEYSLRQQLTETPWAHLISNEKAEALLALPNTLDVLYSAVEGDAGYYLDGFGVIVGRKAESVLMESQQEQSQDPGLTMQL